jgi:hypothetical protein
MPLRIGDGRASRILRGDGLGTAGFGKLGEDVKRDFTGAKV